MADEPNAAEILDNIVWPRGPQLRNAMRSRQPNHLTTRRLASCNTGRGIFNHENTSFGA